MHRGVRRKPIFEDEMDHQVLLQIIKTSLSKYNCWLHAYCLMTNHVHLLLETGDIEIGKFMKYMSECYAIYYNHKYGYRGHVFESRYKSCLVKEDRGEEPEGIWLYRRTVIRWKVKSLQRDSADDHCRPEERNKEDYRAGG